MARKTSDSATNHPKFATTKKRAPPAPFAGLENLTDLAVLVFVARHESFVAAARQTRLSTSRVSRAVARLEAAMGTRLLQRTSRTVVVTDEGRALLARAAPLVEQLEGALAHDYREDAEPRGALRVTAPLFTGTARIAAALADFAAAHPLVRVELDLSNATRSLVDDGFDLAFRAGPLKVSDLVARRVWAAPFGLYASRAFIARELAGKRRVSEAALRKAPAIVSRPAWSFVRKGGEPFAFVPNARFTVNDPRAALEVARRGLGVACLPVDAVAADHARDDDLVALTADFGAPEAREMFAVYPTRTHLPARVRLAIEWVAAPRHLAPSGGRS